MKLSQLLQEKRQDILAIAVNEAAQSENFFVALFRNLIRGAGVTVLLTVFAVFFGLIGGTLVALGLLSPVPIVQ